MDINLGVSTLGSWVLKKDPTPNMPDEDLKVGYHPLGQAGSVQRVISLIQLLLRALFHASAGLRKTTKEI